MIFFTSNLDKFKEDFVLSFLGDQTFLDYYYESLYLPINTMDTIIALDPQMGGVLLPSHKFKDDTYYDTYPSLLNIQSSSWLNVENSNNVEGLILERSNHYVALVRLNDGVNINKWYYRDSAESKSKLKKCFLSFDEFSKIILNQKEDKKIHNILVLYKVNTNDLKAMIDFRYPPVPY